MGCEMKKLLLIIMSLVFMVSLGEAKKARTYKSGGRIKVQKSYIKKSGKVVSPHLKTSPDNTKANNLSNYK